jgi:nickel transport protein
MIVAWAAALIPPDAAAHGTGFRILDGQRPVAVEFVYSSGAPMAYAEALVWSPGDDGVEYQNGRTDRKGRFAFLPDAPGTWKISVRDGRGHKAVAVCPVASGPAPPAPEIPSPFPKTLSALLGISLIANATLALLLFRKKRHRKQLLTSPAEFITK